MRGRRCVRANSVSLAYDSLYELASGQGEAETEYAYYFGHDLHVQVLVVFLLIMLHSI